MKVKITKTIDANQIPSESRKMFDLVKHSLTNALPERLNNAARYLYSSKAEEFFYAIEIIDSLRQDLAALDETLQETQNILSGYKQAVFPVAPEADSDGGVEDSVDEHAEQAEYEKLMSQMDGSDEGDEGEEDEEG